MLAKEDGLHKDAEIPQRIELNTNTNIEFEWLTGWTYATHQSKHVCDACFNKMCCKAENYCLSLAQFTLFIVYCIRCNFLLFYCIQPFCTYATLKVNKYLTYKYALCVLTVHVHIQVQNTHHKDTLWESTCEV